MPILAALAIGGVCGVINGSLIARFKIPAFIATLGMMTVARGFALLYSDRPVSGLTDTYNFVGQGEIFKVFPVGNQPPLGLPIPIIILAVVAISAHIMLNHTRFGRHIYAIGGNEQAALISGLNVGRIQDWRLRNCWSAGWPGWFGAFLPYWLWATPDWVSVMNWMPSPRRSSVVRVCPVVLAQFGGQLSAR